MGGSLVLLSILAIFGLSAFAHDKLKLKVEFTFFLAVSIISSLLYVGALFGILYLTAATMLLLATAMFFYYAYVEFAKIRQISFFKTAEFLSFLVLLSILFVLLSPSYFKEWDEFSHWGLFDKYLVTTHHLATHSNDILFPHYPPAEGLFHYFFQFLSGFSEQISYYANAVMLASGLFCFTAFIKNERSDRVVKTIFVFLIFAFVLELFYKNAWHWLYADHILAVAFAASMLFLYEHRNSRLLHVYLPIPAFFITLIKPYAFIFSGTILVALALYLVVKKDTRYTKSLLTVFVAVFTAYASWALYLKYGTDIRNLSFSIVFGGLRDSFFGNRLEYDMLVINAFLVFLLKKASIVFGIIAILVFAVKRLYKNDKEQMILIYSLLIGVFGFLLFLLMSYLYLFGSVEGPRLASIERYSASYIFSLAAFLLFLLLQKLFSKNINIRFIYGGIVVIVLFFAYKTYGELMKENLVDFRRDAAGMDIGVKAATNTIKKDSKICVISGHFWFDQLYFNYKFLPNMKKYVNITEKGQSKVRLDREDIKKILLEYDYIILHDVPSSFFETYSDIFEVKNNNASFVLYAIDKNSDWKLRVEYEN